jgi:hypothetical protein
MLEEKIARLAADFAAEIIRALTAAPLDELVELASARRARAPARGAPTAPTRTRASKQRTALRPGGPAAEPSFAPAAEPSPEVTAAALAFFVERGSRGATDQQVGERLTELGLAAPAGVIDMLARAGGIRDAGFRRAAGKNATATVYVAS